jgi:energy-coupling factor transporter ATP-binding protein EcfA2
MTLVRSSIEALARLMRRPARKARGEAAPRSSLAEGPAGEEREQLIRRILSSIHNNSVLLSGEPGSGKSSILLYLKGCLSSGSDPAMDFHPVYIDLRGVPEALLFATVADAVLGQLALAPPARVAHFGVDYDHRDLAKDLRGVIRKLTARSSKRSRLVLLVDGMDELNHYDPRTTQKIRSLFMAGFAENLVMVGSAVEIDRHWEQEGSPWFNFFEEIALKTLGREKDHPPGPG